MSTWVRAHVGEQAEQIRVPAAGKAVWVKADGDAAKAGARPVVRTNVAESGAVDTYEPPVTWLVPSFELPPR